MNKKEIQTTLKTGVNAIQFKHNNITCKVWYSLAFKKYRFTDISHRNYEILLTGIEELLNHEDTSDIKVIPLN